MCLTSRYVRQGGYVIIVCLSVCLLAALHRNLQTDLHEIFREGWQWANEQMIKFLVAILFTIWMQGLFSRFVTIGRYVKWYQPTALHDAAVQGIR